MKSLFPLYSIKGNYRSAILHKSTDGSTCGFKGGPPTEVIAYFHDFLPCDNRHTLTASLTVANTFSYADEY